MNLAEKMEAEPIIEYLKKEYSPLSIIVYGSYADGSQNKNSDFDALVIGKNHEKFHDVSIVAGVRLDVFVYPYQYFDTEIDYEDFVQIFDGRVVMDTDDRGLSLKKKVADYINSLPKKTFEELQNDVAWCQKMVLRVERNDAEGMFRWHWVLIDSLEIFCNILDYPYRGPKKSLRWMEVHYPKEFECYFDAMSSFNITSLNHWIECLETHLKSR